MKKHPRESGGSCNRSRWMPKPGESLEDDPTWAEIEADFELRDALRAFHESLSIPPDGANSSIPDDHVKEWFTLSQQLRELLANHEQREAFLHGAANRLANSLTMWAERKIASARASILAGEGTVDTTDIESFVAIGTQGEALLTELRTNAKGADSSRVQFDLPTATDQLQTLHENPDVVQYEHSHAVLKADLQKWRQELRSSIVNNPHQALLAISNTKAAYDTVISEFTNQVGELSASPSAIDHSTQPDFEQWETDLERARTFGELCVQYTETWTAVWSYVEGRVADDGYFAYEADEASYTQKAQLDALVAEHSGERLFELSNPALGELEGHFTELTLKKMPRDVRVDVDRSVIDKDSNVLQLHQEVRISFARDKFGVDEYSATLEDVETAYQREVLETQRRFVDGASYSSEIRLIMENELWVLQSCREVLINAIRKRDQSV